MQLPVNLFKKALRERRLQVGLWLGLANPYTAELLAGTGFDWLVIDAEHSPNDLRSVLTQLQAVAPYPVQPVVRTVCDDVPLIKQYLDIGAQNLLIPMVETAEQAARIVAATRYPPRGIRGVGSALARASRWNQVTDYLPNSDREICVLVQVESTRALDNLSEIGETEGVDGVFFGPSDLAASMGLLGRSGEFRVQEAIRQGIRTVMAKGKAVGVLSTDPDITRSYLDLGAVFVAVGLDTALLVQGARALAARFK
jgi:4-hydroxy-2-oxoheptanedioate aldolase